VTGPSRVVAAALLLGVVGSGAGAWWGERQAVVEEATAVILLNPLQGNPFSPDARGDDLVNLETEAQLVTSDAVLDQLAAVLHDAPVVTSEDVSVSVPPNTQLLSISVSASTQKEAEASAQALATLYLDYRRARTQSAVFDQRANVEEQIEQRTTERSAMVSRLDALERGSPGSSLLTQQILAAVTQISELRTQLGEIGSVSLDPGQLVTPAHATGGGLLPAGPWAPAALGLLLGAAVGAIGAAQLGRRGDLVRTREDLADLGVPCWGSVSAAPDRASAARLRAVLLATRTDPTTVALICRAGPEPTASTRAPRPRLLAESLAESFAAARLRTVLVDVGGSAGGGPRGSAGLVDVVRETQELESALVWEGELGRLPLGDDGAAMDDLAATAEMDIVLLNLRDRADLVLLHAGPADSPRTQALAVGADLVVLEVPLGTVSLASLSRDVEELSQAGAAAIGVVLVSQDAGGRGPSRDRLPQTGASPRSAHAPGAPTLQRRWRSAGWAMRHAARLGLHDTPRARVRSREGA
jgi:succinoglycan biosynthesis transport protein ExoP